MLLSQITNLFYLVGWKNSIILIQKLSVMFWKKLMKINLLTIFPPLVKYSHHLPHPVPPLLPLTLPPRFSWTFSTFRNTSEGGSTASVRSSTMPAWSTILASQSSLRSASVTMETNWTTPASRSPPPPSTAVQCLTVSHATPAYVIVITPTHWPQGQ